MDAEVSQEIRPVLDLPTYLWYPDLAEVHVGGWFGGRYVYPDYNVPPPVPPERRRELDPQYYSEWELRYYYQRSGARSVRPLATNDFIPTRFAFATYSYNDRPTQQGFAEMGWRLVTTFPNHNQGHSGNKLNFFWGELPDRKILDPFKRTADGWNGRTHVDFGFIQSGCCGHIMSAEKFRAHHLKYPTGCMSLCILRCAPNEEPPTSGWIELGASEISRYFYRIVGKEGATLATSKFATAVREAEVTTTAAPPAPPPAPLGPGGKPVFPPFYPTPAATRHYAHPLYYGRDRRGRFISRKP